MWFFPASGTCRICLETEQGPVTPTEVRVSFLHQHISVCRAREGDPVPPTTHSRWREVPLHHLVSEQTLTMGLKVTSTLQDIPADMGPGGSKLQAQPSVGYVIRSTGKAQRGWNQLSGSHGPGQALSGPSGPRPAHPGRRTTGPRCPRSQVPGNIQVTSECVQSE